MRPNAATIPGSMIVGDNAVRDGRSVRNKCQGAAVFTGCVANDRTADNGRVRNASRVQGSAVANGRIAAERRIND